MSRYDYMASMEIVQKDYPFYAMIMAAMRKADNINIEMLKRCWPDVWQELQERYYAPGGFIEGEQREE